MNNLTKAVDFASVLYGEASPEFDGATADGTALVVEGPEQFDSRMASTDSPPRAVHFTLPEPVKHFNGRGRASSSPAMERGTKVYRHIVALEMPGYRRRGLHFLAIHSKRLCSHAKRISVKQDWRFVAEHPRA